MLSISSQQIAYCQSGERDELLNALSNCDFSYTLLEKKTKQLESEIKELKIELSVCNISDSTKSEAIKKLIYEKTLFLERISIYDDKEKVSNLRIQSLENKNKNKWLFSLAGIVIGIFISKI